MAEESGWCTIESDPGVFTELLSAIGVKNVQVEELYSLDKNLLSSYGRVYGLVFLFKYDKKLASARPLAGKLITQPPESLFFANQTIRNACATQAILSIVMNVLGLDIGEKLEGFREFSKGMDPITKGDILPSLEEVRAAHNSFAPQQQFVVEENQGGEKEDPFHFVAYIAHEGKVYELDGLQQGPIELGDAGEGSEWLDVVTPVIERRMSEYNSGAEGAEGEIRFNLMMVVEDARERLKKEVEELRKEGGKEEEIRRLMAEIEGQEEKHGMWKRENVRRRWNFVPFAVEFLKVLAREGKFSKIAEQVREKKKALLREQQSKDGKDVTSVN